MTRSAFRHRLLSAWYSLTPGRPQTTRPTPPAGTRRPRGRQPDLARRLANQTPAQARGTRADRRHAALHQPGHREDDSGEAARDGSTRCRRYRARGATTRRPALAQFQRKQGLDPGGDLDELTLAALGLAQVLTGDVPQAGMRRQRIGGGERRRAAVGEPATHPRGAEQAHRRQAFRRTTCSASGLRDIDNSPRNFQKAKGLDITNTFDLQIIHSLGLTGCADRSEAGQAADRQRRADPVGSRRC